MSELKFVQQRAYDPAFADDYDELFASLHQVERWKHDPEAIHDVCVEDTSQLFLGLRRGEAVAMGTVVKPYHSVGHRTAVFEDIAIKPAYRGQGYGAELVEFMIVQAIQLSATRIELHSSSQRRTAQRLYRRLGFEAINTNLFRQTLDQPFI